MHGKIKIKWEIVITIIISIIGLYVSWQMYNIAKLQTTIAKNSFLPNIVVTEMPQIDTKTGNVIETITTEGAEVANFAILKFTKEGTYKYRFAM